MYKKKLLRLGIPADIRGFEYLNYAISVYVPRQRIMALYEDVAAAFGTKGKYAERDMRHAISTTGKKISVGRFIAKYKILWGEEA